MRKGKPILKRVFILPPEQYSSPEMEQVNLLSRRMQITLHFGPHRLIYSDLLPAITAEQFAAGCRRILGRNNAWAKDAGGL